MNKLQKIKSLTILSIVLFFSVASIGKGVNPPTFIKPIPTLELKVEKARIKIYTMNGQEVWNGQCGEQLPLLPTGVYITKCDLGTLIKCDKIIIN